MIQLIVEASGTRPQTPIQIDTSSFVGPCVVMLVQRFGYPLKDSRGDSILYRLRIAGSHSPLPDTARFQDMQIQSGTHVLLEAEVATVPLVTQDVPSSTEKAFPRLWKRRSFLIWTLASLSVAGTSVGMTTALAQRYLVTRQKGVSLSPRSHSPGPAIPHGAIPQFTFSAHQDTVRAVGWSPDGNVIASGADDSQLLLWNATTVKVLQSIAHPAPILSLAWSPESQRIVTGSGSQVAFFDALSGNMLARSTHQHRGNVSSVAWASNNQMHVVSGGIDKQAFVWDSTTYQVQQVFSRHDTPIEAVTWGTDGQSIASSAQGGAVRVWSAETALEIHNFYQDAPLPIPACAFAPVGTSLAIGGHDGVVRVWENALFCQQQRVGNDGLMCHDVPIRLRAANTPVRSIAWSPDARYLASGKDDGSWSVWSVTQLQSPLFTVVTPPGNAVHSLAWSPNGNQIITATKNVVTLWELQRSTS